MSSSPCLALSSECLSVVVQRLLQRILVTVNAALFNNRRPDNTPGEVDGDIAPNRCHHVNTGHYLMAKVEDIVT